MDGWVGGWMDWWMGGWMDGWMDGWKEGWIDGWKEVGVRPGVVVGRATKPEKRGRVIKTVDHTHQLF